MCLSILLLISLINCVFYYSFFYYLLYSIKNPVSLYRAAFILLILFSLSLITCPIVLHLMGFLSMTCMYSIMMN